MKTLRSHTLALASFALLTSVSGCGVLLGLGDFTEGPGSGGSGGSGGASTNSTTASTGGTAASCMNGTKDPNETDRDCGGTCAPCDDGKGCDNASDCVSHVCSPGGSCSAPTCTDGARNGAETDVDCGGGACPKCADGGMCATAADCASGLCSGGVCFTASCGDGTKNGAETDVDCGGGGCPGCAPTKGCSLPTDCGSGVCKASACVDHHLWSKRFGGAASQGATRVAVDGSGNIVVMGLFEGTIDLGGGPLTNPCVPDPMDPLACNQDYFFARFDSTGKHLWSKRFVNDNDTTTLQGIAFGLDGLDNVFIAAYGSGAFNFGGGAIPDPTPCMMGCDVDAAVVKLSSSGAYQWGKRFATGGDPVVRGVAGGKLGDVTIIGDFTGAVDFGGGALTSKGSYDVFAARLSSSGAHVWSKRFGDATPLEQLGRAIAVDGAGNTLLAGAYKSGVDFGGGNLPTTGGTDLFLAKLDAAGGHVWSKHFGDVQDQFTFSEGMSVAVDPSGNTLFVGRLRGSVSFGGGVLSSPTGKDIFVARFDPAGVHLWSKRFGDTLGAAVTTIDGVAADAAGGVILTGSTAGSVDFGGGPLAGGFLVKLDPSGAHVWSKAFAGRSVATDGASAIVLAGQLSGTHDFGGGPLVSAGASDAFVARFIDP